MADRQEKREKLVDLVHKLFQFNEPELDFGLYRIMHAKSAQARKFLDEERSGEAGVPSLPEPNTRTVCQDI